MTDRMVSTRWPSPDALFDALERAKPDQLVGFRDTLPLLVTNPSVWDFAPVDGTTLRKKREAGGLYVLDFSDTQYRAYIIPAELLENAPPLPLVAGKTRDAAVRSSHALLFLGIAVAVVVAWKVLT